MSIKNIILVLNLVISGIPSILEFYQKEVLYYKVLNLVISGIPSIPPISYLYRQWSVVLNLVISGIPSILLVN